MKIDCDHIEAKCMDSRRRDGYRRRRYLCRCGHRFSSAEIILPDDLLNTAGLDTKKLGFYLTGKDKILTKLKELILLMET